MKKKAIFITCTVVALLAIAAMIVFVFSGRDSDVPEQKVPDLSGAWEVAAMFQNGAPTFVDGQYMTFSDGRAKYYNGNETPSAESSYSIDVDTLKLPEISREYKVVVDTENYVRLYESHEKWMVLIRYPSDDLTETPVDKTKLQGKWNVIYKAGGAVSEVLEFSEDTLNDYRNGATTPDATSAYSWKEGAIVYAEKWNKEFEYHYVSESTIVFIETDTGYVWELERIK